jgi:hypothetical protein
MDTYIIKRYAEVEWNERQAAARHRSPTDAPDRPGLLQRARTRLLLAMATMSRVGRLNARRAAALSSDAAAGSQ